jgi:gliding motility-associated-like protein
VLSIYDVYIDGGTYECIYKGETLDLNAVGQNVLTYQWFPEESLDNSTISDPVSSPEHTITYIISVVSPEGCIAEDSVEVCVDERKSIYLPTAFSPNGDGKNDFYIIGGHGICEIEIFIYNRWGEQVFYSSDISIGWNGVYREVLQGTEKYALLIRGVFCDGTIFGPENSTDQAPGVGSFTLFR